MIYETHPPSRIQLGRSLGQRLQQLKEPLFGVRGLPVLKISLKKNYFHKSIIVKFSLFSDSPPGAVVGVTENLLPRPQGGGVIIAGGGTNVDSVRHGQGSLLQLFIPKLFMIFKSALEMIEAWPLSERKHLLL